MKSMSKRWLLAAAFTIVAVAAVVGSQALDGSGGDALAGTKQGVRPSWRTGADRAACCRAIT